MNLSNARQAAPSGARHPHSDRTRAPVRQRTSCGSPAPYRTWTRLLLWGLVLAVVALAGSGAATAADAPAFSLLFLGDRGHHEPAKRFAWIKDAFAAHGIAATYTEKLDDVNPATLARYDVLMVYANIGRIEPAQEQALLAFVTGGKGFAPIHCASACFGNSPSAVALIGGRFKSHQTAVFAPVIVNHEHPIMQGLAGYTCWDETYVHKDLNPEGRTILAERVDNGQREPWTWVREQGKGRVFYTASGHDGRCWQDASYQELLVRGVAWAAGFKGKALLDSFAGTAAEPGKVP